MIEKLDIFKTEIKKQIEKLDIFKTEIKKQSVDIFITICKVTPIFILKLVPIGVVIYLLSLGDIEKIVSSELAYINLKNNFKFIIRIGTKVGPWLIAASGIIIIWFNLFAKLWKFKIDKFSLKGATFVLDNPESIFEKNVRNFLNTKRTLFKIDRKKDNFYETLNSYYKVYEFLREEIKIFDSESSNDNEKYELANKAIEKLNTFLTKYQNDFRRWYEYTLEKDRDKNYNKDIFHIQKKYRHYHRMVSGFKNVNIFFVNEIAEKFDVSIDKWNIEI